jgi:hypothetical protein
MHALNGQCEKAGHPEVPVAGGSHQPLRVLLAPHFANSCFYHAIESFVSSVSILLQFQLVLVGSISIIAH